MTKYALFKDGVRMDIEPIQVKYQDLIAIIKENPTTIGIPAIYGFDGNFHMKVWPSPSVGYEIREIQTKEGM